MKNLVTLCKISLGLFFVSMIVGFYICTTSPSNVFIGSTISLTGAVIFGAITITIALRIIQSHNKEKEDRIKNLEREVENLKKRLP